jgi:hypothetical protein
MDLIRKFFMPYVDAPACVLGTCPAPVFPVTAASCVCDLATGGVNEVYFIHCTETLSEDNVTDPTWWQGLVTGNKVGRSGIGLGSIGKKSTKNERVGSCRVEQVLSVTWALKYTIKCFDKSAARTTCAKITEVLSNFDKYLAVARMCEGEETVLPIGRFTPTDLDWVVPDSFEDFQNAMFELSWKELSMPCTVDVPGLAAILPKLS